MSPDAQFSKVSSESLPSAQKPPYASFIIGLVLATLLLAVPMAAIGFGVGANSPDAFPVASAITLVAVVGLATWIKKSWEKIKQAEPDTDSKFKRKHRMLGQIMFAVVCFILAGAGSAGFTMGERSAQIREFMSQVKSLAEKGKADKLRFMEIAKRETATMPEYIQRCRDLEPAANQYESSLLQMKALFRSYSEKLAKKKQEPMLTVETIMQMDLDGIIVVKREVAAAKQLADLPPDQQMQFYRDNIQPIMREEDRLAQIEANAIADARSRGIRVGDTTQ